MERKNQMAHLLKVSENRYINVDNISHVLVSSDNTALHIWFSNAKNNIGELVLRGDEGATALDYIDGISFRVPDYMIKE